MSGSTMVMAPAMESSGLSRSHSTPDLTSLPPSFSYRHNVPERRPGQVPEPDFDMPSFNDNFELDTSLSFAEPGAAPSAASQTRLSEAESDAIPHQQQRQQQQQQRPPSPLQLRRSRTGSLMERPRSWFVSSKSMTKLPSSEELECPQNSFGENRTLEVRPTSSGRAAAVQESLSGLTKRSWLSSSRSSSPKRRTNTSKSSHRDRSEVAAPASDSPSDHPSSIKIDDPKATPVANAHPTRRSEAPKPFARATSYFSKMTKPKQPLTKKIGAVHDSDNNSCASSAASLAPPLSSTAEVRYSQSTSCDSNTTATDDSSTDMSPPHQDSDPLWSSFKSLEIEHKGFISRSMQQRAVQIQTIVHPFLRSTMDHASTSKLSPEHLDRRATILNSWWISILDVLDGAGLSSVSGVDRPVMLDTLTAIMLRPEWRLATTSFLPLEDRPDRERTLLRKRKDASLSGSDDSFVDESAEHNVRTMFVCGLARQLAFAIDKMAMRYCPPALVALAGKTCAYAFFFVPGAADMLLRLWGLGPGLITRASDELGLPRRNCGQSDDIVSLFPPSLSNLGWTAPKSAWNELKRTPELPLLVSRIPWTGPWMSRWKGRDTDLLFVFFKHFHILSDNFTPAGLPLTEKARSPGFALVHAQLLSVIDDTIHRQAAMSGPGMMDPMPGADASAMAMPLPPPNLMKGMTENSLVMLLRDVLSGGVLEREGARHTLAEACAAMLKAAVRKTSQYDSPACFTLCDFLEEALAVYDGYEECVSKKYIDWTFWIDVFRRIFCSLNTMSEVRVLSFIYSIWDMLAKDAGRKENVCLGWLLTEDVFESFFNHWCPMVRAYYHRLLCWRICRFEGGADEVDTRIFMTVAARLKSTWSHYLYAKKTAVETGSAAPSSAPMVPTPGKKFMIIRQEVHQPQPGLFVNFDSLARTPGSDVISGEDISGAQPSKPEPKKKSSFLGKVLSFTGTGNGPGASGKGHGRKPSWEEEFINARRETAELRSRANAPPGISPPSSNSDSDSACSSPTYEEQRFVFRFFLAWHQPAMPPRERILVHPRLPAATQAVVSLEPRGMGDPSPTVRGTSPASDADAAESLANSASDDATGFDTKPSRPTGLAAKNVAYCGRALAEWSQVIWECNCFADRRCDEGVPGLGEVEVPILGVDSFRKLGG